jgi:hypothetical protein
MTSWRHLAAGSESTVDCIACGAAVTRDDAREYDKHGDRWDREDKGFEYICKPCHDDLCHRPRDGLESMLVEAGAGTVDRDAFLRSFCRLDSQEAGAASDE